ncbi:MAG: DUF2844 domain-containing protein [Acidobacteria bacterium]|nr:DUF2844 domain-containing protein [Acidobacteriota bacterium]
MKIFLVVFAVLFLISTPGWAVLGEYENSVPSDQQRMHAQLRQVAGQGYTVSQLRSTNGQEVREYVSPAGLVFGVAWQGPTMPDLRQLLGSYFPQLQQAAQSPRRRRGGPLVVKNKDFILVSGGHMRSFHGFAYVPSLLPANVPAEVVK